MTKLMICPNCHGEGTENNPPLRRCGICKGLGRVLVPREKRMIRSSGPSKLSSASASRGAEATGCQASQEAL